MVSALAESPAPWAIPWPCIHEFYSVVTNPKLFTDSALPDRARSQINEWLRSSSLLLLAETAQHWRYLEAYLRESAVVGPTVHDARIAALCLAHGVTELVTQDRDFSRFTKLKIRTLIG